MFSFLTKIRFPRITFRIIPFFIILPFFVFFQPPSFTALGDILILDDEDEDDFLVMEEENDENKMENRGSIFPPVDREILKEMSDARKLVDLERYADAVQLISRILDHPDDFCFPEKDGSGVYRSMKSEANQLLMKMPPRGRQLYELQAGTQAKRELDAAISSGKLEQLGEVARKYFHTEAGYEATFLLGLYHLDHNHAISTALCLQRLYDVPEARKKFDPVLTLLLAVSWNAAGMKERADVLFQSLERMEKASALNQLTIGGKSLSERPASEELSAWLQKELPLLRIFVPSGLKQWAVMRGDLQRNATTDADSSLLTVRWRVPVADSPEAWAILEILRRNRQEAGDTDIPQLFPLAVGDTVLMRTAWNLTAVDLKTGKRLWNVPADGYNDILTRLEKALSQNSQGNDPNHAKIDLVATILRLRVWHEGIYGTLSSNGTLVFCVEDTLNEGIGDNHYTNRIIWRMGGARGRLGMDSEAETSGFPNRLAAYDIQTGKLIWHIGGKPDKWNLPEPNTMFLGPPTPIGDELYVIAQRKGEVVLLVLDAATGKTRWSRLLCEAPEFPGTPYRPALSPSFAEGILICPTPKNAVVAVDVSTHSILWANAYGSEDANQHSSRQRFIHPSAPYSEKVMPVDASLLIADGNVLYMPWDGNAILCMKLLNGQTVWSRPAEDALYLAAVYQGKVYVAKKNGMMALDLAPAKKTRETEQNAKPAEAETPENQQAAQVIALQNIRINGRAVGGIPVAQVRAAGIPVPAEYAPNSPSENRMQPIVGQLSCGNVSGMGFRNDRFYFLPLAEGKIVKIDLPTLTVTETAASREKNIPGNIIPADDRILSQRADHLDAYQQIRSLDTELNRLYAMNTEHPDALVLDAIYRWNDGNFVESVELLRRAVAVGDTQARQLLLRAMMEGIRENFTHFDDRRAEIHSLLTTREEKLEFQRFVILGLEKTGRLQEAVTEYRELLTAMREDSPPAVSETETGSLFGDDRSGWREAPDQWVFTQLERIRRKAEEQNLSEILAEIDSLVEAEFLRLTDLESGKDSSVQSPNSGIPDEIPEVSDENVSVSMSSSVPASDSSESEIWNPESSHDSETVCISVTASGALTDEDSSPEEPREDLPSLAFPPLPVALFEAEPLEAAQAEVAQPVPVAQPAPVAQAVPALPAAPPAIQIQVQIIPQAVPVGGIKPIPVAPIIVAPQNVVRIPATLPSSRTYASEHSPDLPAFLTDTETRKELTRYYSFIRQFRFSPQAEKVKELFIRRLQQSDLFAQAELAVSQRKTLSDREKQAGNWAELVMMFLRANKPVSAAIYYKYAAEAFPEIACFEGKTPAEWLAGIPAEHPIHESLKERPSCASGRVDVRTPENETARQDRSYYYYREQVVKFLGEPSLPFLDMNVIIKVGSSVPQLMVDDMWGQSRWAISIPQERMSQTDVIFYRNLSGMQSVLSRGHYLYATASGGEVIALDFLSEPPRAVWKWSPPRRKPEIDDPLIIPIIRHLEKLSIQSLMLNSHLYRSSGFYSALRMGTEPVLLCANEIGVYILHENSLISLDVLTGEVLWERTLLDGTGSLTGIRNVIGDEDFLYVLGNQIPDAVKPGLLPVAAYPPADIQEMPPVPAEMPGKQKFAENSAFREEIQKLPPYLLLRDVTLDEFYGITAQDAVPKPETPSSSEAFRRFLGISLFHDTFRREYADASAAPAPQTLSVFDTRTGARQESLRVPEIVFLMGSSSQAASKIPCFFNQHCALYDLKNEKFDWIRVSVPKEDGVPREGANLLPEGVNPPPKSGNPVRKPWFRGHLKEKILVYDQESRVQLIDQKSGETLFHTPPLLPVTERAEEKNADAAAPKGNRLSAETKFAENAPGSKKSLPKRENVTGVHFYPDGEDGYIIIVNSQKEKPLPEAAAAEEEISEKNEENVPEKSEEEKKKEEEEATKKEEEKRLAAERLQQQKIRVSPVLSVSDQVYVKNAVIFRVSAKGEVLWPEPIFIRRSFFIGQIPAKIPLLCFSHQKHQRQTTSVLKIYDRNTGRLLYDADTEPQNSSGSIRFSGDPKTNTIRVLLPNNTVLEFLRTAEPWGDYQVTRLRSDAAGEIKQQEIIQNMEKNLKKLKEKVAEAEKNQASLPPPESDENTSPGIQEESLDPVLKPESPKPRIMTDAALKTLKEQIERIETSLSDEKAKYAKITSEEEDEDELYYDDDEEFE